MERQGLEELFARLNKAGDRYLVAGGLAVVAHGYARLTMDVDLVLDLHDDQVERAYGRRLERELTPGVVMSFVGREDLMAMKLEAGRPLDLAGRARPGSHRARGQRMNVGRRMAPSSAPWRPRLRSSSAS